ncbi:MAG: molybdopterin molybdotransferase MoeA [Verrucomicrobiales bacterium]|nr:molybdopterin molybdotransferase MoeA [Verrucomicrobiales bacterium]
MLRELEDVRCELLEGMVPVATELRSLEQATDRVLAVAPVPRTALPPFDNSAMDGYAVRAEDVRSVPVELRVVASVAAGEWCDRRLEAGEAARIFTGAPIPGGADAVVMQEDTEPVTGDPGRIRILDGAKPWENIRFRGEDVPAEAPLLAAGRRLDPTALGILAAAGIGTVEVRRRPRVAILVTGSELVGADARLAPGQIFESNSVMLAALLRRAGGEPRGHPPVPDRAEDIQAALRSAVAESDLVVTVGGASVGEHDLVRQTLTTLGGTVDAWRIAIRPGKPFFRGTLAGVPVLGLPGNPVSAFVTAVLLVLPALRRMQGETSVLPPVTRAVLGEAISNPDSRRHFVRVCTAPDGMIRPSGPQASHRMASLAAADGLLEVAPQTRIESGTLVSVIRW